MTNFKKAIDLLGQRKSEEAIEALKTGSKEGEYHCSYQLANMYRAGSGVPADIEKSNDYFDLALEQAQLHSDQGDALFIIGASSLLGLGRHPLPKEEGQAAIEKGVEKNNLESMLFFINSTRNGEGLNKDLTKAFEVAKKLYDMKLPIGVRLYAESFYFASGVEQDYEKAFKYYNEAADLGDIRSMFSVGTCYHEGRGVDKDEKKAFEYFLKAAEVGYLDAMRNVAYFYSQGIYVEKDYEKEVSWLEKLASTNDGEGMCSLACAYVDKPHGLFKYVEAIELFRKAAARNSMRAKMMLGHIYEFGQYGALPQPNVAFEQYNSAFSLGYMPAAVDLLRCYTDGVGVKPDPMKAAEMQKIVNQLQGNESNSAA